MKKLSQQSLEGSEFKLPIGVSITDPMLYRVYMTEFPPLQKGLGTTHLQPEINANLKIDK